MSRDAARRILRELSEMAEHASLTGAMRGGESRAAARYNGLLRQLEDEEMVARGVFLPLDENNANFGQLAVDARLLLASLRDEDDDDDDDDDDDEDEHCGHRGRGLGTLIALAPFLDSADLAKLVRERINSSSHISEGLLVGLAPFLDKSTLGEILRVRERSQTAPTPPTPPTAPTPPTGSTEPAPPSREIATHGGHLPEVAPNEELARLASRLAHPDITADERAQIAVRLSELALQQGQMARE